MWQEVYPVADAYFERRGQSTVMRDVLYFRLMMRLYCLLILGIIPFCLRAQPSEAPTWEGLLKQHLPRWMEDYHTPGAVIITLEDGAITGQVIRGWADKAQARRLTKKDVVPLGRLTQPLTAYAILQLEAAGLVKLDIPVNTYLEGWALSEGIYNPGDVTIRGLLSHSAGIQSWSEEPTIKADTLTLSDKLNGRDGFPGPRMQDLPDSRYRYSEAGYLIIEKLLSDVTGQSFSSYMKDSVFAVNGMHSGQVENVLPVDSSWARPHHWNRTALQSVHTITAMAARGAFMSPVDYAHFWETLMSSSNTTQQLIWTELQQQQIESSGFFLPAGTGYGFGSGVSRRGDSLTLLTDFTRELSGWANGYCIIPERSSAVFVFTNGVGGGMLVHRIISMWTQQEQNVAPPAKVNLVFWREWMAILLISLVFAVSIYISYRLYASRRQRTLGVATVSQGIFIMGWFLLAILTVQVVLPEIMAYFPHLFLLSVMAIILYLLVLLAWLVTPIRNSLRA